MRPLLLFISMLSLVACESDEAKAKRLRDEKALACLPVELARRKGASPQPNAVAECDVATRDLNRFLSGR